MPLFLDRHDLAGTAFEYMKPEEMMLAHQCDLLEQVKYRVTYLTYWWHSGSKTAFCLVDAPNRQVAEQVHLEAHGEDGIPTNVIEVDWQTIEGFLGPVKIAPPDQIHQDVAFRCILASELSISSGSSIPTEPDLVQHIGDRGGREVQRTNEGLVGCFPSAVAATECALSMQRSFVPLASIYQRSPLNIRVGISAGEPVMNSAGLFGDVVTEATGLCHSAKAGEILVSEAVKALCETRGFTFDQTESGAFSLTGRGMAVLPVAGQYSNNLAGLSLREVEVLQLIAAGKTNQEIADGLFISHNTVASHIRNIFAKIDSANRAEAACYAIRHGLV
jgi:DNA-binding CsgD family transcriptional regulator